MAKSLAIKWNGQQYDVDTTEVDTVGSLKRVIETQTAVQPKRQKLLGLKVTFTYILGPTSTITTITSSCLASR